MSTLDWRELAPPPEIHSCDCDFCEEGGEYLPTQWPSLVRCTVDGAAYITDRYMMLKADVAPIPKDYEVARPDGPILGLDQWRASLVTDQPAIGLAFRWTVIKAMEMTGWRLRLLDHAEDATAHTKLAVAVIDSDGDHIGWAMSAKHRVDDVYSKGFTRDYAEASS